VSGPGKRCHVRFLRLSAKHVTSFCPSFRQKQSRSTQGRRSHCCLHNTVSLRDEQCSIGNKF
jgi:hypothetical protein